MSNEFAVVRSNEVQSVGQAEVAKYPRLPPQRRFLRNTLILNLYLANRVRKPENCFHLAPIARSTLYLLRPSAINPDDLNEAFLADQLCSHLQPLKQARRVVVGLNQAPAVRRPFRKLIEEPNVASFPQSEKIDLRLHVGLHDELEGLPGLSALAADHFRVSLNVHLLDRLGRLGRIRILNRDGAQIEKMPHVVGIVLGLFPCRISSSTTLGLSSIAVKITRCFRDLLLNRTLWGCAASRAPSRLFRTGHRY